MMQVLLVNLVKWKSHFLEFCIKWPFFFLVCGLDFDERPIEVDSGIRLVVAGENADLKVHPRVRYSLIDIPWVLSDTIEMLVSRPTVAYLVTCAA